MIELVLLGTGAMVPLPHRHLSSLLARSEGSLVLFDCGEGTQVAWRRVHRGFKRLDAICLTHHHADHVAGLPGLFHTVANAGRTEPMHIFGPAGTANVIRGLRVIAPHLPYDMVVHELDDGDLFELPGGLQARVALAEHRIRCLAYRVDLPRARAFDRQRAEVLNVPRHDWSTLQRGDVVTVNGRVVEPDDVLGAERPGVAFGFATDTRPTDGIRRLMNGVNLLICEGTYGDDADVDKAREYGHMTFREAAVLAGDANAGALWLTHFGAGMRDPEQFAAAAQGIFPNTVVGRAGLSAQLTFQRGYELLDNGIPPVTEDVVADEG